MDTGAPPDCSSRDDIAKKADGSVDLYFGPRASTGKPTTNWIKTIPGKGWFTYFRLYGPTQAYFDRSWGYRILKDEVMEARDCVGPRVLATAKVVAIEVSSQLARDIEQMFCGVSYYFLFCN